MRAYAFLFLLFIVISCKPSATKESQLYGKWWYEKITKNDTAFIEISQGDELDLALDHIFIYHVKKANKHEQGEWRLLGDTLQFSYQPNGKTRDFIIDEVTEEKLVFHDGDVYFYYKKEN